MEPRRVLVVDDEPSIRFVLERALARAGFAVTVAGSVEEARPLLAANRFAVALLDVRLPGAGGFELLEELKGRPDRPLVVVMTAQDTLRSAVTAMRQGAEDYLVKPFELDRVVAVVGDLAARAGVAAREPAGSPPRELVGVSAAMIEVSKAVGRAAASDLTVLVVGESGTGKELVARAIHEHSARAGGPFVTVNVAAIPRDLLESELYGHEKGAFTGAGGARKGKFELADGGTLFLDEIGELPYELQAKLLRAIQERTVDRVGAERSVPVDVRLVAATNADLAGLVAAAKFRADLYYRLSVLVIGLPPLRERKGDLLPLVRHFVALHGPALRGREVRLAEDVGPALEAHAWPGNVRELENAVQRALLAAPGDVLTGADLARAIAAPGPSPGIAAAAPPDGLDRVLPALVEALPAGAVHAAVFERVEKALLALAMDRFEANQVRAARWLGINRNTLRARLVAHGLLPGRETDG
jgi:two-component system nitrogen regulation response regulator GlnG